MSSPLRIGVIAEGWTDRYVIEAAVMAILPERSFIMTLLQPEDPSATGPFGVRRPGGWGGVYRWFEEMRQRAARLSEDALAHDLVIVHVDADIAQRTYQSAHIDPPLSDDLPCEEPCPPPRATTDRLRQVVLRWMGEVACPTGVVLCTPSKAAEAWVGAALFSNDPAVSNGTIECNLEPDAILQRQPSTRRLVRSGKKQVELYKQEIPNIAAGWVDVERLCPSEASRFRAELTAAAN